MIKIPHKLQGYSEYKSIKIALKNIIHNSLTVDEFEEKRHAFIEKFDLHKNKWLHGLYIERKRWVLIFMKYNFLGRDV